MLFRTVGCILGCMASAVAAQAPNCVGINAVSPQCSSPETLYHRDFFYIGGEYVFNASIKGSLYVDQMYVEKLTPPGGAKKPYPVILISAGVPSGAAWLNTPDNRKGWASWFIEKGYQVYIWDQTAMGRSSSEDVAGYPMRFSGTDTIAQNDYTAPQIIDPYPQSQLHTQWPGNGTKGDPFFDAFFAAFLPLTSNSTRQELSMRTDGCKLLQMIGPSFTISHSAGATYPLLMSDQCPELIMGNVNLEPGNTPFENYVGNATVPAVGRSPARPWGLTNTPIGYFPAISNYTELKTVTVGVDTPAHRSCILQVEPALQLPNIAKVPYLALTGQASPHITYDQCIIEYLNQAGVKTDWIKLADVGIYGNAHFSYLEKNNLQIAAVAEKWIKQHANGIKRTAS